MKETCMFFAHITRITVCSLLSITLLHAIDCTPQLPEELKHKLVILEDFSRKLASCAPAFMYNEIIFLSDDSVKEYSSDTKRLAHLVIDSSSKSINQEVTPALIERAKDINREFLDKLLSNDAFEKAYKTDQEKVAVLYKVANGLHNKEIKAYLHAVITVKYTPAQEKQTSKPYKSAQATIMDLHRKYPDEFPLES